MASRRGTQPSTHSVRSDPARSLIVGPALLAAGSERGPLSGLTFVAKDLFDVAGWPTGAGNPDWLASAPAAASHAAAVAALLAAGASLIGKAHSDELAFSLTGCNAHYGAPVNSAAPGRMPGGSSSGSAAAVASGITDIGLGSDTGGSIRVPASYCGLLGHRPTHGRVSLSGAVALAPTFDTAGLLTRSGTTLRSAMLALLGVGARSGESPDPVRRLLVAQDGVEQLDEASRGPWRACLARLDLPVTDVVLVEEGTGIDGWRAAFQSLQTAEAWSVRGGWFDSGHRRVSADVEARFRSGASVTSDTLRPARQVRAAAKARLAQLLEPGDALVLPAACGVAPLLDTRGPALDEVRRRNLNLTCTAGLAGAPSVALPLATIDGLPLGVCLVALPGRDEALLDVASRVLP
jgi:amidase